MSGNDAVVDALLLRLNTDSSYRRDGTLGIHLADLDPDRCLVKLRKKGSTIRWQPITPALAKCLVDHAAARGAVLPTDPLLRYRDGHPLTSRRYDHLWNASPGSPHKASPPTGSATPPSPGSNGTSDTESPHPRPSHDISPPSQSSG